jgi:geranylgeranyl reductase family protein
MRVIKEITGAMYKVGIVGAGIGGSYLAYLLSKRGIDTVIFDPRAPHEKLCGGGVTPKAMTLFPLLKELPCPRNEVRHIRIVSPNSRAAALDLEKPLTIFNRMDLDSSLLNMATNLGAHFREESVHGFIREEKFWRIFTDRGEYEAEILVGADGAISRTGRMLAGILPGKHDCFVALECFLDTTGDIATFAFFSDFKGYIWEFPRVDRTGVGIMCRYEKAQDISMLKDMISHYIDIHFVSHQKRFSFRGAVIPVFPSYNFHNKRICSDNWALIGDAASFVDPISGEGIYYALYSADILASCITEGKLSEYQRICKERIGGVLLEASRSYQYLYRNEFIGTMVAFAEKSKNIRGTISNMITGDIKYVSYQWRFAKRVISLLSLLA